MQYPKTITCNNLPVTELANNIFFALSYIYPIPCNAAVLCNDGCYWLLKTSRPWWPRLWQEKFN